MIQEIFETTVSDILIQQLTRKELKVLEEMIRWADDEQVCMVLDIQESTFKTHLQNIYRKLGMAVGTGGGKKMRSRAATLQLVKVFIRAVQLKGVLYDG